MRARTPRPHRVAASSSEYLDYFWARVRVSDGCWEWTGNSTGRYGSLPTGRTNRQEYAHRFSWMLHYGPIAARLLVCHHCDNPKCVRPTHFFLGTSLDNVRDMLRKGRNPTGCKTCGGPIVHSRCPPCERARRVEKAAQTQREHAPTLTRAQLEALPERWRLLVISYYGLFGEARQSTAALAALHGVSRQRVSAVLVSSFRRLGVERPRMMCSYPGEYSLTDQIAV